MSEKPRPDTMMTEDGTVKFYDADAMDAWLKTEVLPVLKAIQIALELRWDVRDTDDAIPRLIAQLEEPG